MRDRGKEDDGDPSYLFSRMADDVEILGEPSESFGSEEEWVLQTLEALSNDMKFITAEQKGYRLFERNESVIAVSESFDEFKVFNSPKISVADNFRYSDYGMSMVSDFLLDYVGSSHEGIEEAETVNIEGELSETMDYIVKNYR